MSHRYGRNQRRAHRAQIAALEAAKQDAETARKMSDRLAAHVGAQYRDLLDRVARCLGVNHVALPLDQGRDYVVQALWELEQFRFHVAGFLEPAEMSTIIAEVDHDAPQMQVHCRVRCGREVVGYAISEDALMRTPIGVIVPTVAEQMAAMLIQGIRKMREKKAV